MKKIFLLLLTAGFITSVLAQKMNTGSESYPQPVTFTTQQDHENMMKQLGIKSLRPGKSGNENDPNHANYDESVADPCPQLPDVLTLKNGKKVISPEMWWNQRRPEIIEDFEREVYLHKHQG